jgi:phosphatidate cytidylyltransferase
MTSSIPGDTLISITVMALFLLSVFGLRPGEFRQGLRDLLSDCARALWFVPALASLALFHAELGQAGLISLIALSKVGDIFGYFGGSLFGKHHPLPRLSPGKTTEGFACSLFGGVGVGVALAHWGVLPGEDVSLVSGALIGAAMNVAAQVGDLLESWVKRRSGVKDSGATFGPSGGFLDLLDSFFFTIPVAIWIGLTGA